MSHLSNNAWCWGTQIMSLSGIVVDVVAVGDGHDICSAQPSWLVNAFAVQRFGKTGRILTNFVCICLVRWLDVLQRRCSFHPCPHQISRPPIAHIKTENKTFSNNLTFSVSVIITKPLLPFCFRAAEKRSSDFLIKTAPRLYKPKCNLWLQRCAENCKTLDYDFKAP